MRSRLASYALAPIKLWRAATAITFCFLAGLGLTCSVTASTVPFITGGTVVTGSGPNALASGDFNGDGKQDLVVVDGSVGKLMVLIGKGNGQFLPGVNYPGPVKPDAVQVADINHDGTLDLIATGKGQGGTGSVTVLLGNGDGTFQSPVAYALPAAGFDLAVADFNHDGFPDVAVASSGSGLLVLLNDGTGGLTAPTSYSVGGAGSRLVAGDFNGDGVPDLVVLAGSPFFLANTGNGTFQAGVKITIPAGLASASLAAADLNGDGKLDLAVSGNDITGPGEVAVLLGIGNGTFQGGTLYSTGGVSSNQITSVDMNGDGRPDLIVANGQTDDCSVLLNTGTGTFSAGVTYRTVDGPTAVVAADFNGDGKPDVAVATGDNLISILLGISGGRLSDARDYSAGSGTAFNFTDEVAFGDFNGDGKLDLVVPSESGTGVLLNNGNGTFQNQKLFSVGGSGVAVGDFNGDGKLDLVTGVNPITIALGTGHGTFTKGATYTLSFGQALWFAVGDLNGDGKLDIVATDYNKAVVHVLLGNGDGTFQTPVDIATLRVSGDVILADFNNDGKLDIYLTGYNGGPFGGEILLGNGDGTFQAAKNTGDNGGLTAAVGDFNHDGKLDLALAPLSGSVDIYLGNGDGAFGPVTSYLTGGSQTRSVTVGDFNGDGKLDLAVSSQGKSSYIISVLNGNGDGTFQAAANFNTSFTWAIGSADLNGDGKPDLAVVDARTSGTVAVFLTK
jgi:hypothetical protein